MIIPELQHHLRCCRRLIVCGIFASLLACGGANAVEKGDGVMLLFAELADLRQSRGALFFGASTLTRQGDAEGLDFAFTTVVPHPGGDGFTVYGFQKREGDRHVMLRAETPDGIRFTPAEVVYTFPAMPTPWLTAQICRNPETEEFICLRARMGTPPTKGHPFYLFGSADGRTWQPLADEPLYKGQDALSLMWHPELRRFVNYQTTYQPWKKWFADNMPNVRRVLHIRTSADGRRWEPGDSFGVDGPWLPETMLLTPDAHDPEELEFYRFMAFPYYDRYAGMMLNYIAQPPSLGKSQGFPHGPLYSTEWWVSRDGLRWARPFRNIHAAGQAEANPNMQQPIHAGGELRWVLPYTVNTDTGATTRRGVYAIREERLFSVAARANASFLTPAFSWSGEPLEISAAFGADGTPRAGFFAQGYLMAELCDAEGNTLPGYEKERGLLRRLDDGWTPLTWSPQPARPVTPTQVSLRLHFRDARIFAVRAVR